MKLPKKPSLSNLLEQHAELYREFLPTLTHYQEIAKKALDLQIEITRMRLRETFPDAEYTEAALVTTISAREKPAALPVLLDALAKQKIEVGHIVYDPRTFAFHIYDTNGNQRLGQEGTI